VLLADPFALGLHARESRNVRPRRPDRLWTAAAPWGGPSAKTLGHEQSNLRRLNFERQGTSASGTNANLHASAGTFADPLTHKNRNQRQHAALSRTR